MGAETPNLGRVKMKKEIVIIGYGGHAKSVADCILRDGAYHIAGYTDVEDRNVEYTYLGTDDMLKQVYESGVHEAVLGLGYIGNSTLREGLAKRAKELGFHFPTIIDPSAIIAKNAKIGEGSFLGKRVVVNAEARIGSFCIINNGGIVEHEDIIGDFSHIAVGTTLCGNVKVGRGTFIGAGSTVIQGVTVGGNCVIGAGSLVLGNVTANKKAFGIVKGC